MPNFERMTDIQKMHDTDKAPVSSQMTVSDHKRCTFPIFDT